VFLLYRYWLGSWRAGLVAGVAWLGPWTLDFLADAFFLNAFSLPLIALLFERFALEGRRRFLLGAALLTALQLYNNPYHLVLAALLVAALAARRWRVVLARRNLPALAVSAAAAIACLLPLAVPLLRASAGADLHGAACAAWFSVAPAEWLTAEPQRLLYGGLLARDYRPVSYETMRALFPGVAALALIAAGSILRVRTLAPRRLLVGLFLFAALAATALWPPAFHKQAEGVSLLGLLASRIPLLEHFRVPYRFLTLVALVGAGLAALGYLALERRAAARGARWRRALFAATVLLLTLEALAILRPMHDYRAVFEPSAGDRWAAARGLPRDPNGVILHLPSSLYAKGRALPGGGRARLEEWSAPFFRHLAYRRPIANDRLSFVPPGWVAPEAKRMPGRIAQAYLRAIGVEIVIVHGALLRGEEARAYGRAAMAAAGLEPLAAFGDGDAVYRIPFDVKREPRLEVLPVVGAGGRLELLALTPGRAAAIARPGAPEVPESFWVDPGLCRPRRLTVELRAAGGRIVREEVTWRPPLVVGRAARIAIREPLRREAGRDPVVVGARSADPDIEPVVDPRLAALAAADRSGSPRLKR
jgi:hypothetical protein